MYYANNLYYPPPAPSPGAGGPAPPAPTPPTPPTLISTDAGNALVLGSDGKLYVPTTAADNTAPDFAAAFNALISS
jgi:hypothetical protein